MTNDKTLFINCLLYNNLLNKIHNFLVMIKQKLKKIINFFGYNIHKINKEIRNENLDEIMKRFVSPNPIIFDVGANVGQSIDRFEKTFTNPTIHSFEPINSEFKIIHNKFGKRKNIFLNNIALGDKQEKKLNITAGTGNSSFNKINPGTKWIQTRSKQYNTSEDDYVTKIESVKVETLDNYCNQNNIDKIDILKIDTQGYEDKVLQGSLETIKKNKIGIIITEIMFDNVYDKYFCFSDLEKYLIPNNFRMVGIDMANNNIFSGLVFCADVMYFNKNLHKI